MAARRVGGIDVWLAKNFRHSPKFGFIAAGFEHWDTGTRTRFFVGSEPTGADSITTTCHTINYSAGHGFLVESGDLAQRQRAGDQRHWQHCGGPTGRKFCAHS